MVCEVHGQELLNLVKNWLELINAFESLLDCFELGAELLDGLPLDGMEVATLDQLGQRSVELNYVSHVEQNREEDESEWDYNNNAENTFP